MAADTFDITWVHRPFLVGDKTRNRCSRKLRTLQKQEAITASQKRGRAPLFHCEALVPAPTLGLGSTDDLPAKAKPVDPHIPPALLVSSSPHASDETLLQ